MTPELNKRFCSDNNVPLKIYSGELFIERLKLFGAYSDYLEFCKEYTENFNNEQEYFAYYNAVKDNAIEFIKNSKAFQTLNADDMNKYAVKYSLPQADVYKCSCVGKQFISIDMSKANFSALVAYGRENDAPFFDNFDYDKFIAMFTNIKHIIKSKYIRQVIFGNCNPKRQVGYEKYLMSIILDKLITLGIIAVSDVKSLCSDEIILSADNLDNDKIEKMLDILRDSSKKVPLKIERFKVGKVENTDAYLKEINLSIKYMDGNTVINNGTTLINVKCVNPEQAPFIYRAIARQKIEDNDLIFNYNGKLAKFIDIPKVEINMGDF